MSLEGKPGLEATIHRCRKPDGTDLWRGKRWHTNGGGSHHGCDPPPFMHCPLPDVCRIAVPDERELRGRRPESRDGVPASGVPAGREEGRRARRAFRPDSMIRPEERSRRPCQGVPSAEKENQFMGGSPIPASANVCPPDSRSPASGPSSFPPRSGTCRWDRNQTCQQRRGCRDRRHHAGALLPEPHNTESFPTCSHKPLSGKGERRGLQSLPPPGSLEEKHARKPDGRPPDPERTISITPRQVVLRRTSLYMMQSPQNIVCPSLGKETGTL